MRSTVTLPYEANYTDHWQAAQRRQQTKRWLAERECRLQRLESPPLSPAADDERHLAGDRLQRNERH
jgi:hypothetical protein